MKCCSIADQILDQQDQLILFSQFTRELILYPTLLYVVRVVPTFVVSPQGGTWAHVCAHIITPLYGTILNTPSWDGIN